ncbi:MULTISPECIES: hypothetical protein [unclassified Bradyrhizobium]|uniref:hypothetical protein n=1 Tax=unclassified Bradyrhizobium TaxID=2631580 RepID=UPI002916359C|nr:MULTISPECIES: hypothetical protein [unclassified Bradyrhizobium]
MFKVVAQGTVRFFTHDVKVLIPSDGGHVEEQLKTKFVYLQSDELKEFDLGTIAGTDMFLDKTVMTFLDLADDDGQPIACTPEIRERLLRDPNVRLALSAHYFAAVTKVPEGN